MVEKLIDQKINGADSLGKDPKTSKAVYVLNGRYSPCFKVGKINMSLPEGSTVETVTLDEAVKVLEEKIKDAPATKKAKKITVKKKTPGKKIVVASEDADLKPKGKVVDKKTTKVMLRKK